jgi:hypothetical protein
VIVVLSVLLALEMAT